MCGHAPKVVGDEYETPDLADLIEGMKKFPRYDLALEAGVAVVINIRIWATRGKWQHGG